MTEKEKMLLGYLFDANHDEALARERARCSELCYAYNQLRPTDVEGQQRLLRQMIGRMGKNAAFTAPFWCDYGFNITVGDNFYCNHNCYFTDGVAITIGDNVFIGPNCCLTTAEHALDPEQRSAGMEIARPITIGSNVWLGAGTTVLAGVTIGDNTVIGAGSVVKHPIPANVVAVGVPCRVLREITEADKNRYPQYNG